MKHFFLLLLSIFFAMDLMAQTSPIFIYANSDCSNRLEYHYNGQTNGSGIVSYSFRPDNNQLYLFDVGAEGDRVLKALPKGTVNCSEGQLSDEIVRVINDGSRKAYILRSLNGKYLVSPVASATQVVRAGSTYIFRSYNFEFSIDTTHLEYGMNLASSGSNAYIFYNGTNYNDCYPVYSFKRESDQACLNKIDFDFIPGLGVFSERTGKTPEEALENEYHLYSVNNIEVNSFLSSSCRGEKIRPVESSITTVPVVEQTFIEPDKEIVVSEPVAPTEYATKKPKFVGPRPLVDCIEKPGEGYHIVQPGETLNGIARAYQLKMGSLIAWNKITDPDVLVPCQKVYLTSPPGGIKPDVDKLTGKYVIAGKPNKKPNTTTGRSTKKNRNAVRPVTHSTENVAVRTPTKSQKQTAVAAAQKTVSEPQYAYWNGQKELSNDPNVRIQYVPQYIYINNPTQNVEQLAVTKQKPVAYSTEGTYAATNTNTRSTGKIAPSGVGIVHLVQPGESLYSIARLYGFTAERFRKMNGLPEDYVLQTGMKLLTSDCSCEVPKSSKKTMNTETYSSEPQSTQTNRGETFSETDVVRPLEFSTSTSSSSNRFVEHLVREGETVATVSNRYKISVDELTRANSLESTETLIVGMRLMIPR